MGEPYFQLTNNAMKPTRINSEERPNEAIRKGFLQKGFLSLGTGGGNHKKKDDGKYGELQPASNVIGSGNNSDSRSVIRSGNQNSSNGGDLNSPLDLNTNDSVKNLKNPRQAIRGIQVGPKVGLKPTKQVYRRVSNKNSASTSGKIKQDGLFRPESDGKGSFTVALSSSSSTPIAERIDKLERKMLDGRLMLVDDDGKMLYKAYSTVNADNDSEVEEVSNETVVDDDYDPYDDDVYDGYDMSDNLHAICDDLDIKMALNNAQTKTNSSAFRSMLEKHQLTGPNFNEWLRALKLVVRTKKLQDVFETPLPPAPAQFENKSPQEKITELQKMYGKPLGVELQELVNMFHSCKQAEG
ncbi:hypothetical protein Tco_0184383 [Tanacetum coccineum]